MAGIQPGRDIGYRRAFRIHSGPPPPAPEPPKPHVLPSLVLIFGIVAILFACALENCGSSSHTTTRPTTTPTHTLTPTHLPTRMPTCTIAPYRPNGTPGISARTRIPTPMGTVDWADMGYWELQERYDTFDLGQWEEYARGLVGKRATMRGWVIDCFKHRMYLAVDSPESELSAIYIVFNDDVDGSRYRPGLELLVEGDITDITVTDGYVLVRLSKGRAIILVEPPTPTPTATPTTTPTLGPSPTRTPTPTRTPRPASAYIKVTHAEVREHYDACSTYAEWQAYERTLVGRRVSWTGWVIEVSYDGNSPCLQLDVDPHGAPHVADVIAYIPASAMRLCRRGYSVRVDGRIEYALPLSGSYMLVRLDDCEVFVDDPDLFATPTFTPTPSITPMPTGVWAEMDYRTWWPRHKGMSAEEWQTYNESLIGQRVQWTGWVIEADEETGTLVVDPSNTGGGGIEVLLINVTVRPEEVALFRDRRVIVYGEIASIREELVDGWKEVYHMTMQDCIVRYP